MTNEELFRACKREKDFDVMKKLCAVRATRIGLLTIPQIAEICLVDNRTVKRWLVIFEKEGITGLQDHRRSGNRPKHTDTS